MFPNPREDGNACVILTWTRSMTSPDDNPHSNPESCMAQLLREHIGAPALLLLMLETPRPFHGLRLSETGSTATVESRIGKGDWTCEFTWITSDEDSDISRSLPEMFEDDLFEAVAEQPEALDVLARFIPVRRLHVLDHGVVRLSTTSFSDGWDSGCCGFAYVTPELEPPCDGESHDAYMERCLGLIDAEVREYDLWMNDEFDPEGDYSDYTGLVCPKCGQSAEFDLSAIALSGPVRVTPYGWDWSGAHSAEMLNSTQVQCCHCGHAAAASEFHVSVSD